MPLLVLEIHSAGFLMACFENCPFSTKVGMHLSLGVILATRSNYEGSRLLQSELH